MDIYLTIAGIVILLFLLIIVGGGTHYDKSEIEKELYDAEKMFGDDMSRIKEGILKLDNLLNKALKIKGFRGQTLGERLKSSQKYFKWEDYSGIWEAHKLRNRIVHDDYDPSNIEIKKGIKYFKLAIKKLIK